MTKEEAYQEISPGWVLLLDHFYELVDHLETVDTKPSIWIEEIEIYRGMLRIHTDSDQPLMKEIITKVAWASERESVKICAVCGERGRRRKNLPGRPNRCNKHFLALANEMADRGEI